MKRRILLSALACVMIGGAGCQMDSSGSKMAAKKQPPMTVEQRKEYADKLVAILPSIPPPREGAAENFTSWRARTGALPPDFNSLPKINNLPDPMTFLDGRKVKTAADWKERRAEIISLFEQYDIGHLPPKPKLDKIVPVTAEQAAAAAAARGGGRGAGRAGRGPASGPAVAGGGPATAPAARAGRGGGLGGRGGGGAAPGSVTKIVDLYYGPESQIVQRVTVTIPPGNGPFPVLIGGNAGITSQGYIACSMNESVDDPSRPNLAPYYPGYDWGAMAQTAFTAQMIVDYLYTLPEVDKKCIAITGYSRTGKMAAIATMLDERITACVAGSTGVGGLLPWRSASERGAGEGIESTSRSFFIWFTPSLRYFAGREDRLPVDGNLLGAAIAPRSLISIYGMTDEVGNIYANEQSYYSAQKVYDLLGVPERNAILHPEGHHGANDAVAYMHWLDIQFGKSTDKWVNDYLFPWNFDQWKSKTKESVSLSAYPAKDNTKVLAGVKSKADWEAKSANVRKSVESMLGNKQGGLGGPDPAQRPSDDRFEVVNWAIQRSSSFGWLEPQKSATDFKSITIGDGTRAELYYPKGTAENAKLPTVVWLHGYSYPMGYMWVYRQNPDLHPILALVRAGYAVLAFDQTGHGSRTNEFKTFFDRFPNWSRLGRMVADTRAGIDAIQKDPICDPDKIYLYGYSMGGMVALHTAALDSRVKGVVSICGFTPMRTDTTDKGTGGIARYSVDLPLIPKLGFFIGNESKLPYDYNELIATIAPRPVYVLSPTLDRDATPEDVHAAVDQARGIFNLYDASDKLVLDEPWDYNRLPEVTQDRIIEWMGKNMK